MTNRVLFLNLFSFSITGGIEKFNRAFLKALSELEREEVLLAKAISLYDKDTNDKYFSPGNYFPMGGKKPKFIGQLLKLSFESDTIVIGHLNLALPALIIRYLFPKKKFLLIVHGIEVWQPLKGHKRQLIKKVDQIITVSSFTRSKLVNIQKISEEKIVVFYNTIDPFFKLPTDFGKPGYLGKRYNLKNGEKVVYTLTRMSSNEKYKGYDKVLETLPSLKKKYPGVKYIIGGKADQTERLRIEKLVEEKNIGDNVILAGFIKDEEVNDHFQFADVFVMPSRGEGFGIVFIEAMACGLPVVGGNIDGSVDALQNGRLGKLVDPNNSAEIETAIEEQLNSNTGLAERKKLQQDMLSKFAYQLYKKRLKEILA